MSSNNNIDKDEEFGKRTEDFAQYIRSELRLRISQFVKNYNKGNIDKKDYHSQCAYVCGNIIDLLEEDEEFHCIH